MSEIPMADIANALVAYATKYARTHDEFWTTEQAAEYLKVSPRVVNREVRRGLPHYRFGQGGMRFKKVDIDRYYTKYKIELE
jgi:excisionase family DNA binding protein